MPSIVMEEARGWVVVRDAGFFVVFKSFKKLLFAVEQLMEVLAPL